MTHQKCTVHTYESMIMFHGRRYTIVPDPNYNYFSKLYHPDKNGKQTKSNLESKINVHKLESLFRN